MQWRGMRGEELLVVAPSEARGPVQATRMFRCCTACQGERQTPDARRALAVSPQGAGIRSKPV